MARSPDRKPLDFSAGDPLLPLTQVANRAFRMAAGDMNRYHNTAQAGLGQPVGEILASISSYFTARGYYPDGWTGLGTRGLLMTGGGTTEAYELVIRAIAEDLKSYNTRTGRGLKSVIVMPTPTYGFFFQNPENHGIEVVKIERDWRGDGQLDARKLHALFQQLEKEEKRIVAYYDCNPHNPLGTLRTRRETENVAKVIAWQNRRYEAQDDAYASSAEKHPRRWDTLSSRINIIDDLIYSGLEHGDESPLGFAQLEREEQYRGIFRNTFSLFGPSKAGLVNIRAGLVIGESDHINTMRQIQHSTSYLPPKIAMHALEVFYSDRKDFAGLRQKHLARMNEEHRFAGVLMKALVNGIDQAGAVAPEDREKIIALVGDEKKLKRGIPGIKVITSPQAGFFHLLDFSGLQGRHYGEINRLSEFCDEYAISALGRAQQVQFAYGSWAGLDREDCVVRVSFAKPVEEILDFAARLNAMTRERRPAARNSACKKDSGNSGPICQAG